MMISSFLTGFWKLDIKWREKDKGQFIWVFVLDKIKSAQTVRAKEITSIEKRETVTKIQKPKETPRNYNNTGLSFG